MFGFEIYSSKIYVCSYSEKGSSKAEKNRKCSFRFQDSIFSLVFVIEIDVTRLCYPFHFLNQNFIDAGSVHVDDFESEA